MGTIERLFEHAAWANEKCVAALLRCAPPPREALELFAHVLGAERTWLARLRGELAAVRVWPEADLATLAELAERCRADYAAYLAGLGAADLAGSVDYRNSDGAAFTSRVDDILMHVALHGAYHRGQVMRALRQAGAEPEPTDYIGFARGAPAARRK